MTAIILLGAWSLTDFRLHVGFVFAFVAIQAAFVYALAHHMQKQLDDTK